MNRRYKIKYLVLSKTIPEYSKRDGSLYTCSIGWSPEMGLIRVYPLPITTMNKWDVWEIEVEKNKLDTREESWKLSSYTRKEGWMGVGKDIRCIGTCAGAKKDKVMQLLSQYKYDSISQLNKLRRSIGIIEVKNYNLYWNPNGRFVNTNQIGLFEDVEIADFAKYTKETRDKQAKISFMDNYGKHHNIQFNEWHIYEAQRKFGATKEVFRNMQNKNMLLMGNMHNYRTTWIGLGVFTQHSYVLPLFAEEKIFNPQVQNP